MASERTDPDAASDIVARVLVRGDLAFGLDAVPVPDACGELDQPAVASQVVRTPARGADSDKQAALDALRVRHDRECPHCTVATDHTQTVFGEGDPDADLMFVGEAPGETEDRTGRPFVGRAGKKLEDMIEAMGLSRSQVYIANVLKSRPPDNRTPLRHEIDACGGYLAEQVRIVAPRAIVALGGPAAKLLLETEVGITRLRGTWGRYRPDDLDIPVMPTFHPAYLLRNYTPEVRKQVWSDLQAVLERLGD
ncbi:MAG: uracil-DNA glycosylase [Planctomycetota bacterium]|jgi:DNA polymerase